MRQAGRYLPEYRNVRSQHKNFLDLCFNPSAACEVTLQPIRRFDFDLSIIFSDILVIPYAAGMNVKFIEKKGPFLSGDFGNFDIEKLSPVYEAIKLTRKKLDKTKPLIGFSGAAFTLLTYVITKGKVLGKEEFLTEKLNKNMNKYKKLILKIEDSIVAHLLKQIEAGVNIVKIFDSWAGLLSDHDQFDEFIINSARRVRDKIKEIYPDIPLMFFPRNIGGKYREYSKKVRPDIVTLDYNIDLAWAKSNMPDNVILQGNLNPNILLGSKSEIAKEVKKLENILGKGKYIFNLGHGILPQTPIDNVSYMIEVLRNG